MSALHLFDEMFEEQQLRHSRPVAQRRLKYGHISHQVRRLNAGPDRKIQNLPLADENFHDSKPRITEFHPVRNFFA
jgi:hypothetical protein